MQTRGRLAASEALRAWADTLRAAQVGRSLCAAQAFGLLRRDAQQQRGLRAAIATWRVMAEASGCRQTLYRMFILMNAVK